jgi:hypothetical protein
MKEIPEIQTIIRQRNLFRDHNKTREEIKRKADVQFYAMMHSGMSQETEGGAGVSVLLSKECKTRIP